ncbi:MAG: hypothetical protein SGILL_001094 [Bacillariaceae sp.]
MNMGDLSNSHRRTASDDLVDSGYLDASGNSLSALQLETDGGVSSSNAASSSSYSRSLNSGGGGSSNLTNSNTSGGSGSSARILPPTSRRHRQQQHDRQSSWSESDGVLPPDLESSRSSNRSSNLSSLDSDWNMTPGLAREHSRLLSSEDVLGPFEEEKTTENSELEQLKAHILEGDYVTFINEVDRRCSGGADEEEKMIVLEGLKLFRYHLVKDQMSRPSGVVIPGDGWVKTVTVKLGDCNSDKDIVISCLLTFLTFSTLPGNYKRFMLKKGGVASVMKILDEYKCDNEVPSLVCALLMSLGLSEREGLNARFEKVAILVRRLVSLVVNDESGRDLGLRALFHFAFQRRKSSDTQKSLSHDVKHFLSKEKEIGAIFSVLKEEEVCEMAVESALSLIWRMSGPKDSPGEEDLLSVSTDAVQSVIDAMDAFESMSIREAGCGILANMSMRAAFPSELIEPAFVSITNFLNPKRESSDSVDEGLATCALHSICNMLGDPSTPDISLPVYGNLIEAILTVMDQFPSSEELIEFSCLVISHSSRGNQSVKETVMLLGGFDRVKAAFEEFVTKQADDPSLEVKDASLCALASLTGCRAGAEAVVNSGLLEILETLLAVETDKDFALILEIVARNTKITTESGFQSCSENVVLERPSAFAELIQNAASESEVVCLFQSFVGIGQSGLEMALSREEQFHTFTDALSRYRASQQVQEFGCAILAELYYCAPYPPQPAWSSKSQREALQVVDRAMDNHRDDVNIHINGCLVILNLMSGIRESALDRSAAESMMERCLRAILESLIRHDSNKTLRRSGIAALNASLSIATNEILLTWTARIVRQLYESLPQSSGETEIQSMSLDLLMTLLELNEGIESIGDTNGISVLFELLRSNASEVSGRASSVVAALVERDFMASSRIMESSNAIEILLDCMSANQANLQLQINISCVLEALINFTDSVAIAQILQSGGVMRLCNLMSIHRQSDDFVMYTCNVLSSVFPCLDAKGVSEMSDIIRQSLVDALERHVEKADVEASIFDALWVCCQQEDYFKRLLLEENRIRIILSAMQLNLGSAELQRSGCCLLWMLSSYGNGRDTIGRYGGIPTIVNALLAHNDSTAVQKEGLIALKNLAIASCNKPMLADAGGENAVICSMWIHYKDPQVISIGLSAMNNIAVDSQTRSVAEMNEQILLIVMTAMAHFSNSIDVQKNACFYLKSCSYLPANLQLMRSRGDQLTALLLKAADDFPEECRDRASSIVNKLQAV